MRYFLIAVMSMRNLLSRARESLKNAVLISKLLIFQLWLLAKEKNSLIISRSYWEMFWSMKPRETTRRPKAPSSVIFKISAQRLSIVVWPVSFTGAKTESSFHELSSPANLMSLGSKTPKHFPHLWRWNQYFDKIYSSNLLPEKSSGTW